MSDSPYRYGVKCFVAWSSRTKSWRILGHRWYDVPYLVGEEKDWLKAVTRAQSHVRQGGFVRTASPR